jgi:hypothetical protein
VGKPALGVIEGGCVASGVVPGWGVATTVSCGGGSVGGGLGGGPEGVGVRLGHVWLSPRPAPLPSAGMVASSINANRMVAKKMNDDSLLISIPV